MWGQAVDHFVGALAAAPGHALERAVPVMIPNRDKNGGIREDEGVDKYWNTAPMFIGSRAHSGRYFRYTPN